MAATTTYKRLGSARSPGPDSGSDEEHVVPVPTRAKTSPAQARKGLMRMLAFGMIAATLALLALRKSVLTALQEDYRNALRPTGAPVGIAQQPDEQQQEMLRQREEAQEAAAERAAVAGPEEGVPGEILVEQNDKMRAIDVPSAPVNWDEMLSEAPTRREQVMREWGITMQTEFYTVDEFRELIGFKCPALRHCSIKQAGKVFLGGGRWDELENGGAVFQPHNCWMYQFTGDELWTRGDQAVQKLVIFLDGDAGHSALAEAAQTSDIFQYLDAPMPTSLADEDALHARIQEVLDAHVHAPRLAITLVPNWYNPGKELNLARMIMRLPAQLRTGDTEVESSEVLWAAQPYHGPEGLGEAVRSNEAMHRELKRAVQSDQGAILVRRGPLKPGMRALTNDGGVKLQITMNELKQEISEYALFDVRISTQPFQAAHLGYFNQHSNRLPILRLQNGWTPNLHLDTKLVVFCGTGANANRAVRILRLHGFRYARAMAVNQVRAADMRDLPAPRRIAAGSSFMGLDLFAPSIGAPPTETNPGSSSMLAQYLGNTALNWAFKNEIVGSAQGPAMNHVCQTPDSCTSCFPVVGSIPSDRINFAVLATYLPGRSVPTKILLSEEHKIWDGDWVTFLENNKETQLTVRKNYSTVRTRKFEKQPLPSYLEAANIVAKSDAGEYKETGEAPRHDPNSLPVYAGNNKLDRFSMAEYNFKYPEWIRRNSFQRPAMWLGPKGSLSSLHVDHTNRGNLAYQVLGAKKWHLVPPRNRPFMYGKKVGVVIWSTLIDPDLYNADKARELPLFKLGLPESVVINVEQGEMLYNPDEWWHVVYNTEASLMLNFWLKASVPVLPPPPGQQQQQQQAQK